MSQDIRIRPEQEQVTPARRALTVAALALPVLLIAIDISVMGVALPRIAEALRPSAAELLWITDSYNYLVAATMLTMGAVADRFGRRRVIVLCAWVFALASVVGAFAPNALWLIVARGVMGIAGSAIFPASMAVIGGLYTEQTARVRAFGAFMTIFLGGMTIAPFVGGLLLHGFWWGSVLLVGAPVMVVAAIAVPLLAPESRSEEPPRIDVLSTAQSVAGILLVVAAVKAFATDDASPLAWAGLVLGLAVGVLFIRRQLRIEHPLVDIRALTGSATAQVLAVLFLTALLMGGTSLFYNLYLQEVQGLSALRAAGYMVPGMVAMIIAVNVGPRIAERLGRRRMLLGMLSIQALGFVAYTVLPVGGYGAALASAGGALATFGIGACFPLLMDLAMGSAPPERAGAAAALAQVGNELGIAVGITVLGAIGTLVYRAGLDRPGSPAEASIVAGVAEGRTDAALLEGARTAFTASYRVVGLCAVATMLVVLVIVARLTREDAPGQQRSST